MQVRSIEVQKINPAPYNPRKDLKPGDPEYEKLQRSIETYGCVEPPVWNRQTGHLVGGHQRFKVLKARGDAEIDVVEVDLSLADEKALNIALNKIDGAWDEGKLAELLTELVVEPDIDATVTGFYGVEIEHLIADLAKDTELDLEALDEVEEPAEPITKPGDLICLGPSGEHRLLCGEVVSPADVARLLGNERASMNHTDPPYGVSYDRNKRPTSAKRGKTGPSGKPSEDRIINDNLTPRQYARWFPKVLEALDESLIPGGAFYIWNAHKCFGLMHDLLTERKFKVSSTITWAKESFSPGFGDYNEQVEYCLYGYKAGARHRWYGPRNASTLWDVHRDRTREYKHPTQKPLELAERAIRNSSKRGEIVFDPFLGSGTTLLAAAALGRRCLGMEIDPRDCDTIVRRYIALAGPQAVPPEVAQAYSWTQGSSAA
ncbi:site-specific DNA-methyltransferase [Algisphaera agarilytica]|uniref:Methyltransferase n=1 Tax=Algisphaera agarilytica TaxID=1385975 RepID=A0A7X0LJA1_9BACT|nr:DNA modification methylase [Algisphaera agarilytica]MBB6429105.1 DNA modification methylase [Algisphaera agarilytica]